MKGGPPPTTVPAEHSSFSSSADAARRPAGQNGASVCDDAAFYRIQGDADAPVTAFTVDSERTSLGGFDTPSQ
jgi:hypothetical protein